MKKAYRYEHLEKKGDFVIPDSSTDEVADGEKNVIKEMWYRISVAYHTLKQKIPIETHLPASWAVAMLPCFWSSYYSQLEALEYSNSKSIAGGKMRGGGP